MQNRFGRNGGGEGPDLHEVLQKVSDAIRRNLSRAGPILVGVALVLGALSGVYKVGPGEQGVVQTFGRESGKTGPGLHFAFPLVQRASVANIEQVRRVEVGFRGQERIANEALMITGDENIVEAQVIVQYRITDPSKFLFRLRDPEEGLRAAAEVALRGMVGRTTIDDVMTTGREKVQVETQAWLQTLMDNYQSGLTITEVKLQVVDAPDAVRDAFHDVVRAREEKEQKINQAKGYQADVIPRARGEAQKIAREAEAYEQERVLRANGDAAKFVAVYEEYRKAERVTRSRLHLETMARILKSVQHKTIVDGDLTRNTLPVLPLGAAVVAGTSPGAGK